MGEPMLQGKDERVIAAPAAAVWAVVEDTSALPEWVPMVTRVDVPAGRKERAGESRTCDITMMGRHGQITERCLTLVPERYALYSVERDSFGFSTLTDRFRFSITLDPLGPDSTAVSLASYYQPRGPLGGVVNVLVFKRTLRRSRRRMLAQLAAVVERKVLAGRTGA